MHAGDQIGDYRVIELVGVGGQAEVALSECVNPDNARGLYGQKVALKKFYYQAQSEKSNQAFLERAEALLSFDHPHIVQYLDYFMWGEDRLEKCLVMEFIEGQTIRDYLISWNSDDTETNLLEGFDWEEASSCMDAVCEGLIYARDRGLTHRDIKPDNIVIGNDGVVKVLDFDIARMVDDHRTHRSKSRNMTPIAYMAPEFLDPNFMGDEQSDILSLGVTLYESLCGETHCEQDESGMFRIALKHPAVDDYVLPGIQHLLATAIEPSRQKRYAHIEAFQRDLRQISRRVIQGGRSYQLQRFIKRGGFGAVYEAKALDSEERLAIKRLDPPPLSKIAAAEHRRKFSREANLLCQTKHPGIVQYVEYIEDGPDRTPFLVLEFLEGMPGASLSARIRKCGCLDPLYVIALFRHYVDGLQELHNASIIHRDISPDNLYAPDNPQQARIFDLGVARNAKETMTSGKLATKLQYASPDFMRERGTPGTDLFSLGCCLFEALTGNKAFPLPSDPDESIRMFRERMMHPKKHPLPLDAHAGLIPQPLKTVLLRACHPSVKQRYSSAISMKADLLFAARQLGAAEPEEVHAETTYATEPMDQVVTAATDHVAVEGSVATPAQQQETRATNAWVPSEHAVTQCIDQAHVIETRIRHARYRRILFKCACALLVILLIGTGVWWGPIWWQSYRMQHFLDTYQPETSSEKVLALHNRYKTVQSWIQKERYSPARLQNWKIKIASIINQSPQVFLSAARNNPAAISTYTEAWQTLEPVLIAHDKHGIWKQTEGTMQMLALQQKVQAISSLDDLQRLSDLFTSITNDHSSFSGEVLSRVENHLDERAQTLFAEEIEMLQNSQDISELEAFARTLRASPFPRVDIRNRMLANVAARRNTLLESQQTEEVREQQQSDAKDKLETAYNTFAEFQTHSLQELQQALSTIRDYGAFARQAPGGRELETSFRRAFIEKTLKYLSTYDPLADRYMRLQQFQETLLPDIRNAFTESERNAIEESWDREKGTFVLRLHNDTAFDTDADLVDTEGNVIATQGVAAQSKADVRLPGITNRRNLKLTLTPRSEPGYLSSRFNLVALPGHAASQRIPPFSPRPVVIRVVSGGGSAVSLKQMDIAYRIDEGTWRPYAQDQELKALPNQTITFRFARDGFASVLSSPLQIPFGETEIPVYAPAADKWRSETVVRKEKVARAIANLEQEMSDPIQEYIASLYQFKELRSNLQTTIAPVWRHRSRLPQFSTQIRTALQQLDPGTDKELREQLAFLSLWTRTNQQGFEDALQAYIAHAGKTTLYQRKARFIARLLSNPADQDILMLGLGGQRWQAHRSFSNFDSDALSRLRKLDSYRSQNEGINEYDLRLGFVLAFLTWQDAITTEYDDFLLKRRRAGSIGGDFRLSGSGSNKVRESVRIIRDLLTAAEPIMRQNVIAHTKQVANTQGKAAEVASGVLAANIMSLEQDTSASMDPVVAAIIRYILDQSQ